ncbi:PREDICTED: uncharacterized protein LOC105585499 [Cercocebus atys]|uniref:uncharacterized protein LOC105585499 n=1 Tax=Cercocebus atys TaxID=9531 RepID=UPI0005F4B5D3|nr:PREDICTED: uncharacterized protein LOC105585499 [Cercocebus atys]
MKDSSCSTVTPPPLPASALAWPSRLFLPPVLGVQESPTAVGWGWGHSSPKPERLEPMALPPHSPPASEKKPWYLYLRNEDNINNDGGRAGLQGLWSLLGPGTRLVFQPR